MKKILFPFLFIISLLSAHAQNAYDLKIDKTDTLVYSMVDKIPQFPGGMPVFYEYLRKSIRYPALAREKNIQGRVILSMIIEKDGTVGRVKVERGVDESLNQEAVRVMLASPQWIPASKNGMIVRVRFAIPISFTIAQGSPNGNLTVDTSNRPRLAVENLPQFPGGMVEFYNFLSSNIHYPPTARQKKIEGRLVISMVVERDGSLTEIKVAKGVSDDIDQEALRVVGLSPKWKPGTQNGKPVRVAYSIPISFALKN